RRWRAPLNNKGALLQKDGCAPQRMRPRPRAGDHPRWDGRMFGFDRHPPIFFAPRAGLAGRWPAAPHQATISVTSMLPRVALEYGHTMCAFCTSSSTGSRGTPGTLMVSSASMPKPVGIWPMPTLPVTVVSAGRATLAWPATDVRATRQKAEEADEKGW